MTGRVDQSFRKSASPGSFAERATRRCPRKGESAKQNHSRGASLRPRLAHHAATKRKATKLCLPPKREAERRKAHCPTNVRVKRGCALLCGGAPPFGAHACGTRHRLLPRWLSSRTGFPAALTGGCLPAAPNAAVKHAPCGPVLVPVDRGSEAARVRSGILRPRAPRLARVLAACLPEGALN